MSEKKLRKWWYMIKVWFNPQFCVMCGCKMSKSGYCSYCYGN